MLTKDILFGMNILTLAGFAVMGLTLTLNRMGQAGRLLSIGLMGAGTALVFFGLYMWAAGRAKAPRPASYSLLDAPEWRSAWSSTRKGWKRRVTHGESIEHQRRYRCRNRLGRGHHKGRCRRLWPHETPKT
jgi:hypothetical protein